MKISWLGWADLNRRMTESKSVALPLGYIPTTSVYEKRFQGFTGEGIAPSYYPASSRVER